MANSSTNQRELLQLRQSTATGHRSKWPQHAFLEVKTQIWIGTVLQRSVIYLKALMSLLFY